MQRRELKARAHKLEPVVTIGNKGLTEALFAEIDRALKAHELIKIKAMLDGKVFVVYRKNEDA